MKRNRQEERLKELGRLDAENSKLDTRNLDWIPVEEPQFLGWELQVVLGESGTRRRDAEDLLKVMDIARVSEISFTRHEWISKLIKSQSGRYYQIKEAFFKWYYRNRRTYPFGYNDDWIRRHYFPYWDTKCISQKDYDELEPRLRKYFLGEKHSATTWRPEYYTYRINQFPRHELVIKCTKAYSTHRGIPHSEEIAREKEIYDTLRDNRYWCAKNGFSRWGGDQNWVRRYNRKLTRKHWRSCLQEVGKVDFNPWYGWYGEIEREDPLELLEKEEKRLWGYSRIIKN